jgi:phenylacetate-CoA ligase
MFDEALQLAMLSLGRRLPPDGQEATQRRGLRAMVRHAYQNVPYYRQLFRTSGILPEDIRSAEDLKHLPITTKNDLRRSRPDNILARNIDPRTYRSLSTSGSTGEPFTIKLTSRDIQARRIIRFRSLRAAGLRRKDRLVYLASCKGSRIRLHHRLGFYPVQFIDYELPIEQLVLRLEQLRPTVLWTFPSVLRVLLHHLDGRLSKIARPRLVITSAETLDEPLRRWLLADQQPALINFYGSSEVSCIAGECRAREGLHVNTDSLILEYVEDPSRGVRTAVITSLINFAMPFIRYNLGDVGGYLGRRCSCGTALPLIRPPQGRTEDVIWLPSGRPLLSFLLTTVLESLTGLRQFRLVQERIDKMVVEMAISPSPSKAILDDISRRLLHAIGEPVELELRLFERFPQGIDKFKSVVSLTSLSTRAI